MGVMQCKLVCTLGTHIVLLYKLHLQFTFRCAPSPMVTVAMTSKLPLPLQPHLQVHRDSSAMPVVDVPMGIVLVILYFSHLATETACYAITSDALNSVTCRVAPTSFQKVKSGPS